MSHFNEDLVHNSTLYNVQVYEMIKICTYFTKQNKKCLISVKLENQKFMLLCWLSRFHSMLIDSLQVQTGRKYDVSLDASYSFSKFVFKLGVSDGFSSLHQLTESLFQSPHTADDATLKYVGHFADL